MTFETIQNFLATAFRNTFGVIADNGHFLSVFPLVFALAIALFILRTRLLRKNKGERLTSRQLLRALFPKRVYWHRSAKSDYLVFLINQGLLFFITVSTLLSPAMVSEATLAIFNIMEIPAAKQDAGLFERIIYSIYITLLWDFSSTYAHYLKHKVPFLWEFHKVHHSAEVMTPVTALRRHPFEAIFAALMSSLVIGTGIAVWVLVFGQGLNLVTLFGAVFGIYLWRLLGYNLRHSHVWISYGDFWNRIFISPAQHQVHHSVEPRHFDTNFGHIFAFWDYLLGTLYLPKHEERVKFGIDEKEMRDYDSLYGLYILPIIKSGRVLRRQLGLSANKSGQRKSRS